MDKLHTERVVFLSVVILLCGIVTPGSSSGWRRRRDWGEITDGADDDGKEFARISVSTGTAGGGERESSEDDPPDIDTFKEDVDFDINYQQNGRVIGTATNNEPGAGRSRRSGRKTSTTSKHTERHRRRGTLHGGNQDTVKKQRASRRHRLMRRLKTRYTNVQQSRNTAKNNKNVRNKHLQKDRKRQTKRDDDEDDEEEKDDREDDKNEEKNREANKQARMERYNEYLVKKDINDYFSQSKNAADDEEVFDRSERAYRKSVSSGRRAEDRPHNVTVHGGKKLGVIKPIATGIEVDIDGLGRGEGSVSSTGLNDVQPPWLRDQPPDEPEQMTMTDLSELNPLTKYQDIPNHLNLFSHNPQVDVKWKEPKMMSNCWIHAMLAPNYSFSPSCNPDGTYLAKQCYLQRCWCVTRRGDPVVKKPPSRFYYKKDGIRLHCVEIPPRRGERPPTLPTTPEPTPGHGPAAEPDSKDEGPIVMSRGDAAVANIPIHFQIVN